MLWDLYNTKENSSAVISYFKGLNRKYKANIGEFSDMRNMSSDGYPCMVPRRNRKKIYDGYKNIRLVIKPLNKSLKDGIPSFCGIADDDKGNPCLYYNGEKVRVDMNTFSSGFKSENKTSDGEYGDIFYNDCSSLFPTGEGTKYSYVYFNNRLFLFISNQNRWEINGIDDVDKDGLEATITGDRAITLNKSITEAEAMQMLHRNISLKATWQSHFENKNYDYDMRYYVTEVKAGEDGKTTLTVSESICTNPYNSNSKPTKFQLHPVYDSIKMYYDAGKNRAKLKNAERGIHNFAGEIKKDGYTDPETGIHYYPVCCITIRKDMAEKADNENGRAITKILRKGDRVKLSGSTSEKNNTVIVDNDFKDLNGDEIVSATFLGIENRGTEGDADSGIYDIYLQFINANGETVSPKTSQNYESDETKHGYNPYLSLAKVVPDMISIVAHNQRLWGVNPNGQYYYASALSDPFTWYGGVYGKESAPIEMMSDTEDEYNGIVDFGQYVILMKPTSIQQIYAPASASGVNITRAMYNVGCIDIKSAVVIGTSLYYLGYNGFYRYSGSAPEIISSKLCKKYISAGAITDGVKYYVSAVLSDGETEFLVYDTQYDIWHKEDNLKVLGGYIWYDKPIVVAEDGAYRFNSSEDEDFEWSAQSTLMFEGTMDNKALNEIWIRAQIPNGKSVKLETRTNTTDWKEHFELKGTGDIKVYRIPIRAITSEYYEFKLSGIGYAVIYDIERKVHFDGRPHSGR